jgi:hypothetical protein
VPACFDLTQGLARSAGKACPDIAINRGFKVKRCLVPSLGVFTLVHQAEKLLCGF